MTSKLTQDFFRDARVVIVDDDINSLDVAMIVLDYAGAEVVTASNGEDALRTIRSVNPSFVISDISMPILDGWQLIRRIREDEILKNLPVIALTAHAMLGDRERILNAGFDGYLSKPLQPAKFIADLLSVLNTSANVSQS